jgi:hypothetical protein
MLQRKRNHGRERIHKSGNGRALFRHPHEDLAPARPLEKSAQEHVSPPSHIMALSRIDGQAVEGFADFVAFPPRHPLECTEGWP